MPPARGEPHRIEVPPGVRLRCEVGGRLYAVTVARDPKPPHGDVLMLGAAGPVPKLAKARRKAGLAGTLFEGAKEPASGTRFVPPAVLVLARQFDLDRAYGLANFLGRLGYHADARIDHGAGADGHGREGQEAEEGEGTEAEEGAAVHDDGLP